MTALNVIEMLKSARRLGLSLRALGMVLLLQLISLLFEVAAVAMLLPIFEILKAGQTASIDQFQGQYWDVARQISAYTGIPITLGTLLIISFVSLLSRQAISYISAAYSSSVRLRTANKLLQRAFQRFLFARTDLQDEAALGDVTEILRSDLGRALDTLFALPRAAGTLFQLTVYLGSLFLLSWPMTLVSLALIAVVVFFSRGQFKKIRKYGEEFSLTNRELSGFVLERVRHVRLIRLSGTEKAEINEVYRLARENSDVVYHQSLLSTRIALSMEPIAIGFAFVVLYGGFQLGYSLERLGLFAIVLVRLMRIVQGNISQYLSVLGKVPSLARLENYLIETARERESRGGDRVFRQLSKSIIFEDVSFRYPTGKVPALRDVTVTVPARRFTALVGPSGAGKSTFIDMLPGLRAPSSGMIKLDDLPLAEFSTQSVRAGIAFVSQQPQIFNSTAAEHIRYGKEDATDEEVREAARLAGALEFIEALPDGFNTRLGEGGKKLSGGQRQRIDIARALVRNSPILILDEPTSALDAEAESAFRDVLRRLRNETRLTIIVIAHRFSTIIDADQIIVLHQGRIAGAGTHRHLMRQCDWYADAFRKQQLEPNAAGVAFGVMGESW